MQQKLTDKNIKGEKVLDAKYLNIQCFMCLKQADYDVLGFWNLWKTWKNALPSKSQSCDCSGNSFVVAACCVNLQVARCTLSAFSSQLHLAGR